MIKFNLYKEGGLKVHFIKKNEDINSEFKKFLESKKFDGQFNKILYLPIIEGDSHVFIGLGDDEIDLEDIRNIFFKLGNTLRKNEEHEVEIKMPEFNICNRKTIMAAYEGLRHGEYEFTKKTDVKHKKEDFELTVNYSAFKGPEEKLREGLNKMENIMDGVFLARNLVNERANVIYPESLANIAVEKLENLGVNVCVYEEDEIEKIGMKAFLKVAAGATNRPRLIVMEYKNSDAEKIALVGKGLTYDSGGYNIKSPSGMNYMHCDMGGAATVIGTMYALAKNKAKVNVVGVIAACENMISGTSYKSGDVIDSMKGLTIEVANTDAEGRITLADAVHYATNDLGAEKIIDLATLTGAVTIALGEVYTGAVTNDEDFYREVLEAAELSGEKIWAFPYDEDFKKLNNSEVADIKNTSGRDAGSVTAGLFVGEFVKENTPWVHLDIAATAYRNKAKGYLPKNATGIHVKTLNNLLDPIDC
ncbi:leucyl aminopeptidase [Peptoniphilus sp. AGMB00490]|uniref:Probable cytosol aminopeptidase n=1 Tax=Peptoniphilus faecalis TaxID=2731255 RepID=A0A848RLV6_9FIRM|nr:leucyl aminopeptidase [Peptoniphilus faecalis]NMW85282.1 leucyl aminopeptidase [Peptoniphilus faecalis]